MKSGLIKEDEKTFSILGGFYHNAKELKEAADYYGKAAAINNDGKLYLKQARLLTLQEKHKEAIPVLKKALAAGGVSEGEVEFELTLAYLGTKQIKAAYNACLKAAKDEKTKRSATSYLAYIKEKARIYNVAL